MDSSSTIPDDYLLRSGQAKDLALRGAPMFLNAETVKVDLDRRLWVHPGAACSADPQAISSPRVRVRREECGLAVLLDRRELDSFLWEVDEGFDPERTDGVRWMAVARVLEAGSPRREATEGRADPA